MSVVLAQELGDLAEQAGPAGSPGLGVDDGGPDATLDVEPQCARALGRPRRPPELAGGQAGGRVEAAVTERPQGGGEIEGTIEHEPHAAGPYPPPPVPAGVQSVPGCSAGEHRQRCPIARRAPAERCVGQDAGMDPVVVDVPRPGITRITLNRPDKLNAMNTELVQQLHRALDDVAVDPACRVVVLTGAGRGFCAGLDLRGYGEAPDSEGFGRPQAGFAVQRHIARLIPHLRSLPQPVIAAVNGPAAGGGFALVLGSDIRIAATTARFNAAFIRIGLSACDIGTSWLLPRLVGAARAHELMLTGTHLRRRRRPSASAS